MIPPLRRRRRGAPWRDISRPCASARTVPLGEAVSLPNLLNDLAQIPDYRQYGRVTAVLGMLLELGGVPQSLAVGGRCEIAGRYGNRLPCEVVGFRGGRALLMPFGSIDGIGLGCKAEV